MSGRVRTVEHVADLLRRPGAQRALRHEVPAAVLGPLATTSVVVPTGGEVRLDATAEATGADVVVTGRVRFPWEGDCRRCLAPVEGEVEVDVREIFEPNPVEAETWPLDGDSIDLGPMLREVALLSLPLVPLCSEDCAGPDPERFPATVEGDADGEAAGPDGDDDEPAAEGPRDPRWAALDELRFD